MWNALIVEGGYLIGAVTFVLGLKMLSHPETARRGNLLAAFGMALAIAVTLFFYRRDGQPVGNLPWILLAMAIGTVIGWWMAVKVKMTAMPQMVSFFNGMGGACAALIALVEYQAHPQHDVGFLLSIFLGLVIGSVSFSGSMVAYLKLEGKVGNIHHTALRVFNVLVLLAILAFIVVGTLGMEPFGEGRLPWVLFVIALLYGVMFVMPIGGADMPVVISLLNSFTGVAAAMGGFLYDNMIMLTGGILVGSAGTILTILMTKAMNRSLFNVLVGAFGGAGATGAGKDGDKTVKEISIPDAAIMLAYSQRVAIIPGYGLAVAQAQHACHDLEKALEEKGVEVYYAIHPVAGRMPGHMNVLLAEADVPYDKLLEAEQANELLPQTDVAIVVGANDVVNPLAETDPSSPIAGMPVIRAWEAKRVIVIKRSLRPGYAKIDNPLFYLDNTYMLFNDAKKALSELVLEVKQA